jgi:L-proline amide hydrolase
MTPAIVAVIREGERSGRTDTPEFEAAVYRTVNGPTEFTVVGTIRDFDLNDRLGEVEVPVLLVSGAHDEVRPWVVEGMQRRLPRGEWVLFQDSSHMPHVEEPERFASVVGAFLGRVDARG